MKTGAKLISAIILKTVLPFAGLLLAVNGNAPEGAALGLATIAFADRLIETC